MTEAPPVPLAPSVALLARSANYALDALSAVTDDDLHRPTLCAEWDLRRLVLHCADSADGLAALATTGELRFPTPRSDDPDPVAVAQDRLRRLLDVLESTAEIGGDQLQWATTAAHAGAIEFAAHGWDISVACGTEHPIPAELASKVLELATSLINDDSRAPRFGPVVSVPRTATPSDQFVAFLGRRPRSVA